jgi:nicotinate phosphoribosyltransferase
MDLKMANTMALEHWVDVYRGDLGIALSDYFYHNEFYEVFDKKFTKLFDGVRQDSGDPIEFANKTIAHYKSMGIDPLSKTIIFFRCIGPGKSETDHRILSRPDWNFIWYRNQFY